MKILTVLSLISSEGYFGAETMLVTLAQNLSRFDCHCIVGVLSDRRFPKSGVAEQAQRHGLSVETVWCDGRADWKAVKRIRSLLVQHNVDILNPHGYKADLYAFAAASSNRVALVATIHNWPSKLLIMRAYAALDRLVLGRFDKVIGVSDVPSDILRRWGVAPGKVSTIFNGVDIDRFDGAVPTLRNEIVSDGYSLVGFVGRLVPDKGGSLLLRAAQQVLAVRPKTVFVLVGEGSARKEWQALAKQLGIEKYVAFAGTRDDMPGVYASLDMVVLPSLVESMPMCLLEAMAAGKPVIATRVGAVPKLITSERNGLLLEPGNVDELVAAILRLLGDPELATTLGKNGRVCAAQHFSAEAMARSYIRQYEQVLARRCTGSRKQAAVGVSPR